MRFIDERSKTTTAFEKIKEGEVFFCEDIGEYENVPYIKIFNIIDEDGQWNNAVCLTDGVPIFFEQSEAVIKCGACLKIY